MKLFIESIILCAALLLGQAAAQTAVAPAAPVAPSAPAADENKDLHIKIDLKATESDDTGDSALISIDTEVDADENDGPVGRAVRKGVAEMLEEHLLDRESLSDEDRAEVREAIAELRSETGESKDAGTTSKDQGRSIIIGAGDHSNDEDDFGAFEAAAAITAITFGLGMPIFIVAMILYFAYRRRRLAHDTINQYLSSGKEIPPEIMQNLFKDAAGKPATPRTNLHKGAINASLGLGMVIGFNAIDVEFLAAIGFIFLLVGLAQMLIWKLEYGKEGDKAQG